MQAKWAHILYMPVDPKVWRQMHRLYLFAEREAFDRAPVHLYPLQDETTCASEYLQAMMLHLANPASLLPAQIAMVDTWLDSWAKSLVIESNFRPHRQLYTTNLGDMKPARKLRRNMLGEKYRYWGVGLMLVTITKVVEQLKQGASPASLKLGEDCRLPSCYDLIEEVANRWAGQSSTRKHERSPVEKSLWVSQGLNNILAQLQGTRRRAATAATYSATDMPIGGQPAGAPVPSGEEDLFDAPAQQWQVEDESLSGFGVKFARDGATQLKIGTLVSLKERSAKHVAIGIVRRTVNEPPAQVRAGVQTLTQTPVLVELLPLPQEKGELVYAIYLPELPKLQLGRSLLLPHEAYMQNKLVQLRAQGKTYTIRLQPAVERGLDYIQAGFDAVAKV
jgi:cyclic-di-GMP-binding protein